jgi:hypothetical protein
VADAQFRRRRILQRRTVSYQFLEFGYAENVANPSIFVYDGMRMLSVSFLGILSGPILGNRNLSLKKLFNKAS